MIKNIGMVFIIFLLSACASVDNYDLPEAFLVVDGKQHEMTGGTFCWGDMCSDSFAYTTDKNPVYINKNSELKIQFKSKSKIREVYLKSISTEYLELVILPEEDGSKEYNEDAKEFNKKYSVWRAKSEHEEYVFEHSENAQIQLAPSMQQKVENNYENGDFILSVGSWWEDGDIFFDILVQVQP